MQDFNKYNFSITLDDLKRFMQDYDGDIVVVINGEFYDLEVSDD